MGLGSWKQRQTYCSPSSDTHVLPLRAKNKRELNAKLKGATLGDAEGEVDDTLKWIKRSKKKEKELAKKRQEELENMDKLLLGDDYTESSLTILIVAFVHLLTICVAEDLEGLKVSHDFEGLEEGEARILTLKDSRILDNEGGYMRLCCRCALISHHSQRMSCRTSKWQSASARRRIRSSRSNGETTLATTMTSLLLVRQV